MQEIFENIIEKLEERTSFLSDCTKYGNKDAEQQNKSYSTMMMYEVSDLVDDLIEIVKQGGVSDDCCEWKHFCNDKSPYRPSCSQYMKSKFEAFKFGDYCPFCGKKIKVVE